MCGRYKRPENPNILIQVGVALCLPIVHQAPNNCRSQKSIQMQFLRSLPSIVPGSSMESDITLLDNPQTCHSCRAATRTAFSQKTVRNCSRNWPIALLVLRKKVRIAPWPLGTELGQKVTTFAAEIKRASRISAPKCGEAGRVQCRDVSTFVDVTIMNRDAMKFQNFQVTSKISDRFDNLPMAWVASNR